MHKLRKFVTFVTVRETRFDIKCFRERMEFVDIYCTVLRQFSNHSQFATFQGKWIFKN